MQLPFNLSLEKPLTKILLATLLVVVSIGVGFLIYSLFFKASEPEVVIPPTTPGAGLPSADVGVPGVIIPTVPSILPEGVVSPTVFIPGPEAGAIASPIAQGGITQINTVSFDPNVSSQLASDGRNLVSYDSSNGKFYTTTATGQRFALSDKQFFEVQDVSWAKSTSKAILEYPDGSNIYYDFDTDTQITLPNTWTEFDFTENDDLFVYSPL